MKHKKAIRRHTTPLTIRIGSILRTMRKEHGMTLDDAAIRVDISISTLSRIERGEYDTHITLLYAILKLYGYEFYQIAYWMNRESIDKK